MKIIRFLSEDGQICQGLYESDEPKQARLIAGELFGPFRITEEKRSIGRILPPLTPVNILALGINYRRHADETNIDAPESPVVFLKATTSIIGHQAPIVLPDAGPDQVDYEAELAVIIGKKIKNIKPSEALDSIFGYACANDVSARDWQFEKQKGQWARGKSFDTFCPLGPCMVTKEDIPDPNNLQIRTWINGKIFQDSNTANMIFHIPEIISSLSQSMTLLPGTVILTGTPEGVGFTRQPPVFLKEGDVVIIDIERVGQLTNAVIRETSVRSED
jgi:2-keto-4-pentenoate hydratase/2-oxohepta-3-ene-1,7-dioic acid hydratase in catechol pathway